MMNNNNNHLGLFLQLPDDITIDILSRLPVESVLQCNLVCKSWHILINDPDFGHTHTDRLLLQLQLDAAGSSGNYNPNNNISFGFFLCTSRERMLEYHFGEYNIHHHDLSSTFRHKKLPIVYHEPFLSLYERCYNYVHPVGSCNGLICLLSNANDDFNMCIYNPLTTEYVNLLPRFNIINNDGTRLSSSQQNCAAGFGYHPGTKEYKIVRIYYENTCENTCSSGQVSVYTLGSGGGWRSKGETSHILYGGQGVQGVFANGALHWIANRMLVGINEYIVSFDLVDEEFRIISSPPPNVYHIELGVLEGCLSATGTNYYSPQSTSDVWVMTKDKEEDQKEYTWSQKYNIPWNEPSRQYMPPLAPLFKGDANANANNKILLQYAYMKMVTYDTKRECLDDNVHTMELVNFYDLVPYMKSFASLEALGEDGARIGKFTSVIISENDSSCRECSKEMERETTTGKEEAQEKKKAKVDQKAEIKF